MEIIRCSNRKYLRSTLMLNPLAFKREFDLKTAITRLAVKNASPVTLPHLVSSIFELEMLLLYIVKLSFTQPALSSKSNELNSKRMPNSANFE